MPSVAWEGALRDWETAFRNGRPRGGMISSDLFGSYIHGQLQGIMPSVGSALAARSALKFRPWWGLGGEAGDWAAPMRRAVPVGESVTAHSSLTDSAGNSVGKNSWGISSGQLLR